MSIIGSYAPFSLSSQGGYLLRMQEGNDDYNHNYSYSVFCNISVQTHHVHIMYSVRCMFTVHEFAL